jgi:MFS superfamily sulfate permease-like transporter
MSVVTKSCTSFDSHPGRAIGGCVVTLLYIIYIKPLFTYMPMATIEGLIHIVVLVVIVDARWVRSANTCGDSRCTLGAFCKYKSIP